MEDNEVLCREHAVVLFYKDGVHAIFQYVRDLSKITDIFKNLVVEASKCGILDQWALCYEITYFDGTVSRYPICSGNFDDFVDAENYELSVHL